MSNPLQCLLAGGMAVGLVAASACGGGGGDGGITPPTPVAQVVFSITVTSAAGVAPDTLHTTGRTRQFNAAAADSNLNAIPGTTFTWSSTTPAVATVDALGLITAVADGLTSIQATAGSPTVTGSRSLRVLRFASVFTLVPTAPPALTTAGGTQVFNGTAQDSAGTNLLIAWLSRTTSVATVSPATGTSTTATAVANGTTRIVMSGGTRTDSATLVVNVPVAVVSFAGQVQPIFTASCAVAGCHVAPSPTGPGLILSAGSARANLVGIASVGFAGATLVIAGDSVNSYLIRKLKGVNIAGVRMPEGAAALSPATITIIATWITQGALDN